MSALKLQINSLRAGQFRVNRVPDPKIPVIGQNDPGALILGRFGFIGTAVSKPCAFTALVHN